LADRKPPDGDQCGLPTSLTPPDHRPHRDEKRVYDEASAKLGDGFGDGIQVAAAHADRIGE
jgi:hypothetical protein